MIKAMRLPFVNQSISMIQWLRGAVKFPRMDLQFVAGRHWTLVWNFLAPEFWNNNCRNHCQVQNRHTNREMGHKNREKSIISNFLQTNLWFWRKTTGLATTTITTTMQTTTTTSTDNQQSNKNSWKSFGKVPFSYMKKNTLLFFFFSFLPNSDGDLRTLSYGIEQ